LKGGIWLADPHKGGGAGKGFKTGRSKISIVRRSRDQSILEITIREGRNRQVRRMCEAIGHPVRRLVRVRIGTLRDAQLAPGEWRELRLDEVRKLEAPPATRRRR
jgi:23S rRNA pseudouridine2605 synthase